MEVVISLILLFVASFGCGSCENSTECYKSCVSKVFDCRENELIGIVLWLC